VTGETDLTRQRWYRYEMVAHLDAQTYDFRIWLIGEKNVTQKHVITTDPVFVQTDVPFCHPVSEISTFVIHGWGLGNSLTGNAQYRAKFDNIQVWKNVGGTETRLYLNIVSVRERSITVPHAATTLAEQYDRDDGADHWVRQSGVGASSRYLEATVRGSEDNRYLAIGRVTPGGTKMRYAQTLDRVRGTDGELTFSVDMRPPQAFSTVNGFAAIGLGDARQGDVSSGADEKAGSVALFGFRDVSGKLDNGRVSTVYAFSRGFDAQAGAATNYAWSVGLNNDHWFRFKAKFDMKTRTYDLKIFDMGDVQPTSETADGTLFASVLDVDFADQTATSVSALSISAAGVGSTYGYTGDDPACALVDNVWMEWNKGMTVIFR